MVLLEEICTLQFWKTDIKELKENMHMILLMEQF